VGACEVGIDEDPQLRVRETYNADIADTF